MLLNPTATIVTCDERRKLLIPHENVVEKKKYIPDLTLFLLIKKKTKQNKHNKQPVVVHDKVWWEYVTHL